MFLYVKRKTPSPKTGNKRPQESASRNNETLAVEGAEPTAKSTFSSISHEIHANFMRDQSGIAATIITAITADRLTNAVMRWERH
jgi:hypothetical protein